MVNGTWDDTTLTICLPERIDASNAAEAGEEIDSLLNKQETEKVIFDASDMNYISSAGLRIVLKVAKSNHSVAVINETKEVYDIFEISGFTNFISVEIPA